MKCDILTDISLYTSGALFTLHAEYSVATLYNTHVHMHACTTCYDQFHHIHIIDTSSCTSITMLLLISTN